MAAEFLATRLRSILYPKSLLYTITKGSSVRTAVNRMVDNNVGSLVVIENDSSSSSTEICGIVTERDYLRKMIGKCVDRTSVKDIMTSPVSIVPADVSVADCIQIMIDGDFRHLPVVLPDKNNKKSSQNQKADLSGNKKEELIGVVSMRDVVRELVNQNKDEQDYLRSQINKLANAVGSTK